MASGTIKAVASKADIDALNSKIDDFMKIVPITVTADTTKVTCWEALCYVRAGWCTLRLNYFCGKTVGNSQTGLITGLPKAKAATQANFGYENPAQQAAVGYGESFWINKGGTSLAGSFTQTARPVWLSLVYMVDDET